MFRRFLSVVLSCILAFGATLALDATPLAYADTLQSQIDSQNAQIAALNAQIAVYQAQIQKAGADKKTLQSAIATLDLQRTKLQTQISAMQHQISATQLQIQALGSDITTTEDQIVVSQAGLAEDLRSLAATDTKPLILQLFSADSLGDAWDDVSSNFELQEAITTNIGDLQGQKDDLAASQAASKQKKTALTSQQQQLTSQQQSLVATKAQKTQLLVQTSNSETAYQKLLAQAQAELASFSTFAQNAGGSGILTNQTVCDDWGCYYNQRDSQWGNMLLSGTNDRLAADGCLVTSMAMVMTHYGYPDVNPISINSNPGNFSAVGGLLLATINVDGVSATRKATAIDATLSTGNPVVVGLYAYGGTHFVVLTSGSKGNYLMRDPYQPNAKDIPFTKYYAIRNIYGITKVLITS